MLEKLLVKGEKTIICRVNDPSQQMVFELIYPRQSGFLYDVDIFAYMIEDRGRVHRKNIIFYNNSGTADSGIVYDELYESMQIKKNLEINLNKLQSSIETICFACSIYCKNRLGRKEPMYVDLQMQAVNKTLRSHMFSSRDMIDIVENQTFIMGELYKYKDTWKYNAVKQEMDGGLMSVMRKMYHLAVY